MTHYEWLATLKVGDIVYITSACGWSQAEPIVEIRHGTPRYMTSNGGGFDEDGSNPWFRILSKPCKLLPVDPRDD